MSEFPAPSGPEPDPVAVATARNVRYLRQLYGALTSVGVPAFIELLPEDVSVFMPGNTGFAGQIEGRDEVANWLRRFVELSGGTFRFEPAESVTADADNGFVLVTEWAERESRFLRITDVHVWRIQVRPDGDLRLSCSVYTGEQYAWDEFWS